MKVIFLDIDGVLNGYDWTDQFIMYPLFKLSRILKITKIFKKWYDPFMINELYVKNLSKIIQATDAKIVISSSWRHSWHKPYEKCTKEMKRLKRLFSKYKIEVIGVTEYLSSGKRGEEIKRYLDTHKALNITKFVIIDDEDFDIKNIFSEEIILTRSKNVALIQGHWKECTGLRRKYIKKVIKLLNEGD